MELSYHEPAIFLCIGQLVTGHFRIFLNLEFCDCSVDVKVVPSHFTVDWFCFDLPLGTYRAIRLLGTPEKCNDL